MSAITLKYEGELDVTALKVVKVERIHNGVPRSRKVPVFAPKHGIVALFHVVDKFVKAGERLNFEIEDYWNQFEDVLDIVAGSKWENQVRVIGPRARTRERFKTEVDKFIASYAKHSEPQDILVRYLRNPENCRKPYKATPQAHVDHLETLIGYANRLEGTEPQVDEENRKKIIF